MTEPLGRSQVLEYLIDLSHNTNVTLVSFERSKDLSSIEEINTIVKKHGIQWHYLPYSNKFGLISSLFQIMRSVLLGSKVIKSEKIQIIHARSMIPAVIGIILKKLYKVKLLFDIRGFAIDEKVDSGRLKKNTPLYRMLKYIDNHLYKHSDHVVTLTLVAKEILQKKLNITENKITVIPTCVNKNIFKPLAIDEIYTLKKKLNYHPENDKVIIHTGTVSGWYDFEKEMILVREMMNHDDNLHFIILNKNEHDYINDYLVNFRFPKNRVKVLSTSFNKVHKYLNIADASLFFIKSSYSKQASAPTKFAENVACYLPSITNENVGDMGYYINQYDVGTAIYLDTFNKNITSTALDLLKNIDHIKLNKKEYDKLIIEHFDKEIAVKKYSDIYDTLIGEN